MPKRDINFCLIQGPGWNISNETPYWIALPLIALWGAWALWHLSRQ